jgi:MoxR-like ATPase
MDYTTKVDDIPDGAAVPDPIATQPDHPRFYRPDQGLVDAVNVALMLERPLLLTGDPGTGKTQLAYSLAWQLASRKAMKVTSARVARFETKSTSVSRDLFYEFDVVGRFQARTWGSTDVLDYLTYKALGSAIIDGLPRSEVAPYLPWDYKHEGPRRSVVLIDEIDKAPRDFPNDLLTEIDNMFFRVTELGNAQIGGGETVGLRPIVVITSNSEKSLPEPFLRRCIYYDIPTPLEGKLQRILEARLSHLGASKGKLIETAREFYEKMLENRVAQRKISVAELLQWLTYMLKQGASPNQPLTAYKDLAIRGIPALTKNRDDQKRVKAELETSAPGS